MGVRIKPVQPTVITDKAIIEQIIKEIRRPPTPECIAKLERDAEMFKKMIKPCKKNYG